MRGQPSQRFNQPQSSSEIVIKRQVRADGAVCPCHPRSNELAYLKIRSIASATSAIAWPRGFVVMLHSNPVSIAGRVGNYGVERS